MPPNVIIEIKDPKEKSFSFKRHSGKGEEQWKVLKAKVESFPWLEIFYVVRFARKEWRYYQMPVEAKTLKISNGSDVGNLINLLKERQNLMPRQNLMLTDPMEMAQHIGGRNSEKGALK